MSCTEAPNSIAKRCPAWRCSIERKEAWRYMYKYLRLGIRCRRRPKTPGIPGLVQSVAPVGLGRGSYRSPSVSRRWVGVGHPTSASLQSPQRSSRLTCISARPSLAWATCLERAETGRPCLRLGDGLGVGICRIYIVHLYIISPHKSAWSAPPSMQTPTAAPGRLGAAADGRRRRDAGCAD